MFAHYSSGANPLHVLLIKMGIDVGVKLREDNKSGDDINFEDLLKNF
jgi:hypothetical protein